MASNIDATVTAVITLLTAGGGKFAWDAVKAYKKGPPRAIVIADANLDAIVRARDEVVEDNLRLRQERVEQDERHAAERSRWVSDQDRLRADIARLEQQLRDERAASDLRSKELERTIREEREAANQRYDALLKQVQQMGHRTDDMEGGA